MNQIKQNPVVVVMGAGNATGSAVARRFASEGYTACVSRRNEEKLQPLIQSIEEAGGQARAFGADARKEEQVQAMFRAVEEEIGPIEVCVFNVGGNVKFPLEDTLHGSTTKSGRWAVLQDFSPDARRFIS